ncbi:MAG: zinc ABC transporter substrate-binding protein [Erysipelotrichaceae bacterium]|nr:zinc ABC transporter substrate-binding protein [Erysipelotrichaceae bacterium]
MKIIKKLLLVGLVLVLCACSSAKQYVAYTIYPVGYLLNRIGGDRINAISIQNNSLVQRSQIVENYKEILEDSSVLFYIGDLEPYLYAYEDDVDETGVVWQDLSVLNALYDFKRYSLVYVDGKQNFVESDYYEGDEFADIDMYGLDLNIWLSPTGMRSMAINVKDYLASNYVEQSSYFQENFDVLYDELIVLDAAYNALATKLNASNKTIKFVSMTPSFGCWQKDYGFQVYPVCLSKYGTLPTDAQLAKIKEKIINDDVKYIAYEPNMTSDMSDLMIQLEEELGLKRISLNNISSITDSQIQNGKDYLSLMYENLSTLESIASVED